jgi:hypothetical protein
MKCYHCDLLLDYKVYENYTQYTCSNHDKCSIEIIIYHNQHPKIKGWDVIGITYRKAIIYSFLESDGMSYFHKFNFDRIKLENNFVITRSIEEILSKIDNLLLFG